MGKCFDLKHDPEPYLNDRNSLKESMEKQPKFLEPSDTNILL